VRILLLGATGVLGNAALQRALADTRIKQVIAPTRRSLASHPKLFNPVSTELNVLFSGAEKWDVNAVICAIGSTIGKAGSKEAFRYVDYTLPMAFGKLAYQRGARALVLVSSPGASLHIPLHYCRVKGEIERDIKNIGFNSLTIVRPGMIGGHREEFRLAEFIVLPIANFLRPILPRGLHINPAANIAKVMIEAAIIQQPGQYMKTSRDLT
jgi:uncharacterized protein YbjT (DUF2867 family)